MYKPKREAWNRSFPRAFGIKKKERKKALVSWTSTLQDCKKISFYDLSHLVCCTLLRDTCVLTHSLVLCYPMDCSLPGTYFHGIFQARIQEWVAIFSSRGSFQPRDWTHISCIGWWILYQCPTRAVWLQRPSSQSDRHTVSGYYCFLLLMTIALLFPMSSKITWLGRKTKQNKTLICKTNNHRGSTVKCRLLYSIL